MLCCFQFEIVMIRLFFRTAKTRQAFDLFKNNPSRFQWHVNLKGLSVFSLKMKNLEWTKRSQELISRKAAEAQRNYPDKCFLYLLYKSKTLKKSFETFCMHTQILC